MPRASLDVKPYVLRSGAALCLGIGISILLVQRTCDFFLPSCAPFAVAGNAYLALGGLLAVISSAMQWAVSQNAKEFLVREVAGLAIGLIITFITILVGIGGSTSLLAISIVGGLVIGAALTVVVLRALNRH